MIELVHAVTDPLAHGFYGVLNCLGIPFTANSTSAFIADRVRTWLLADAHLPAAAEVMQRPGRKIGVIRCGKRFAYNPQSYDTLIVFTEFVRQAVTRIYPVLAPKIRLARMPFDPLPFHAYRPTDRDHREVIFAQPFLMGSLNILEVYLVEPLLTNGRRATHLFSDSHPVFCLPEADKMLLREAEKRGLQAVSRYDRNSYYHRMAKAATLICLDWESCPSLLMAASAMNLNVIAPAAGAYSEMVPRGLLFPPVNLAAVLALTEKPANIAFDPEPFLPEKVSADYTCLET